jgi:hypothetical protein
LGQLLHVVATEVSKKYPNDKNVMLTALGGFVYLRLINPAILNPEYYGIIGKYILVYYKY